MSQADATMGDSVTRSKPVKLSSKADMKMTISMVADNLDKENRSPVVVKDVKASSSLADIGTKEALTKVRKKTTARVPPPLALPTSSPLSPAAEEFHLPPYVSSLPTSTTLASMMSTMSLTPPFSPHIPPPSLYQQNHQPHSHSVTAVVEQPGFISFKMRHGVVLDISANMAIRLTNTPKDSSISLSSCTTQMAVVHPKGRMLQYGPRVEVQCEDDVSVKNAKIYPRGISFTANNMALVYLLDEAGARSTSDMFHDLYATQIADTLFMESCEREGQAVTTSIQQLDKARYWRTQGSVECWVIGPVFIQQTEDGLVIVERETQQGDKFILKTSPSNGKVKVESWFLQMTASLGMESHLFLRSKDRRLHYSGETKVFTVRNAGHSAGFDEEGSLRIF